MPTVCEKCGHKAEGWRDLVMHQAARTDTGRLLLCKEGITK